jgi:hypothetical protein
MDNEGVGCAMDLNKDRVQWRSVSELKSDDVHGKYSKPKKS